jgi:serine phosphatase RsbU (regulator of sigma subunit)
LKIGKKTKSVGRDSRKIPINPITLSYLSQDLQDEYNRDYLPRSLKVVRISLLLAAVIYLSFGIIDQFSVREAADKVFYIRVGISLFFFSIIFLTYTEFVKNTFQILMMLVVVVGSISIIFILLVTGTATGYNYSAALILAIIFAHSLLRLRFIHASLTSWSIFILYEFVELTMKVTPQEVLLTNSFFLFSANILGMFSSYGLEYYMRTAFWQRKQLVEEQTKLKLEHDRKTNELEAARRIQLAMLPKSVPAHPLVDVCVSMNTAVEIGGDYYDFHVREDNTVTFAIGDATGHGAQAGIMVTATKMLFANLAESNEITDIMKRASRSIKRMGIQKLYMAMAVGRIRDKKLELVGAGIPPALHYRSSTATIEKIPLKGVPLGSFVDFPYKKKEISLESGDTLLFMTDGFPELFNGNGEMLGYDRVIDIFHDIAERQPTDIVKRLNAHVHLWLNGTPQQDDTTFIVMKVRTPDNSPTVDDADPTV